MATFPAPTNQPAPISPLVPLNSPMVGFASPFDHADGQNRDLILEAIRTWASVNLLTWSSSWQAFFTGWIASVDAYISANATTGPVGPPGPNTIPTDTFIATSINTPASATAAALVAAYGLYAPAPTGIAATDTANLQALITQAQTTKGTLYLQAGTYVVTNLTTTAAGTQPRIIGKGHNLTTIQGTTLGAALTLLGNQTGTFSGGYLSDITFTGTGIGLALQGCVEVHWNRLNFIGALNTGILFSNALTGDFTEFCSGQANLACKTAVEYRAIAGAGSFNGSGLTGESTINQPSTATGPVILIGPNAQPYNAPLSVMIWTYTAAQPLIANRSASAVNFCGALKMELFTPTAILADPASVSPLYFTGTYNVFGGNRGGVTAGPFIFTTNVTFDGTGVVYTADTGWINYTPALANITLGNGTLTARYRANGKTVELECTLVFGTTSSVGTNPALQLPINAPRNGAGGVGIFNRYGVGNFVMPVQVTTSQLQLFSLSTNGAFATITASTPYAFGSLDTFTISAHYESV